MRRYLDALRASPLSHALLAIVTALAAVGVTIVVDDQGPGHRTVTVHVGGPTVPATSTVDSSAKPGVQPTVVKAPPAAARDVAGSPELVQAGGLRNEAPAGVTLEQVDRSIAKQEALAQNDQLPIVQPDAAPSQRGCVSRFVRNYSSRRGVRPREWTLHYTVSANRPGWSDVWAIVNLFNTTSAQASSNYVIDSEGHCAYIVRESDKAWTQAGGNPYAISVEVVATGKEHRYLEPAGARKLAMVMSDSLKRWGIPVQRGAVSGCVPRRAGIIQHRDWGACGGGHFDISPFSVAPVIASVAAYRRAHASRPVGRTDRLRCSRLNAWRAAGRPAKDTHANVLRKHTLEAHRVACEPGKPARRLR